MITQTGTESELIYRQQAIDAMAELQGRASTKAELKGISKAWKRIKRLPSAQPIILCKDCKWFNDIGCAIRIVDDTDKPSEEDYCSFAERREDG